MKITVEQAETLNYTMERFKYAIKGIMEHLGLAKDVGAVEIVDKYRRTLKKQKVIGNFDQVPIATNIRFLNIHREYRSDSLKK